MKELLTFQILVKLFEIAQATFCTAASAERVVENQNRIKWNEVDNRSRNTKWEFKIFVEKAGNSSERLMKSENCESKFE